MNSRNAAKPAIGAILIASGIASAASDLTLARSYELSNTSSQYNTLLSQSNLAELKIGVQIQSRYQFNSRDNKGTTLASPDDDITTGFVIRRAKVGIEGKVTDNISGKLKFAFDRKTGGAELEDAYGKWKINDDVTLKFGQFKPHFLHEENLSSSKQLGTDRSAANETFNQDFTQGVELDFGGDRWRAMVGFNDGFKTGKTAFNSPAESDVAFTGRVEFLLGDADFHAFKQFTSFRGSNAGGLIGAAIHYQSKGDTNPSFTPTTDLTTATVDFSWVDDGWNFYAAGVWRNTDTGVMSFDDYGVVVQGGFFVADQDEIFARFDGVYSDSNYAVTNQDFNSMTVGWNHYIVPESHAAKFTLDVGMHLDPTTTSVVKTSDGHNLLSDSTDGQIGVTAQLQLLF